MFCLSGRGPLELPELASFSEQADRILPRGPRKAQKHRSRGDSKVPAFWVGLTMGAGHPRSLTLWRIAFPMTATTGREPVLTASQTQHLPWPKHLLNAHALLPHSRANGPGLRAVIWLQGCTRRCFGCFNPDTQPLEPRRLCTPEELWEWLNSVSGIEGVTISGGEPLLQAKPLVALLNVVRSRSEFSVVLYSGYSIEEIYCLPGGPDVLSLVDVLVDGPYDHSQPADDGIRGSRNQGVRLLTDRYGPGDLKLAGTFEVVIRPDGTVIRTGVPVRRPPPAGAALPPGQ